MNLRKILKKTRDNFSKNLRNLFGKRDPKALVDIENLLIESDFGINTAASLIKKLEKVSPDKYLSTLRDELINILKKYRPNEDIPIDRKQLAKLKTIGKRIR